MDDTSTPVTAEAEATQTTPCTSDSTTCTKDCTEAGECTDAEVEADADETD